MKYRMNGKLRTYVGSIVYELVVSLVKTRPKAPQDRISEKRSAARGVYLLVMLLPTITSLPKLEYQNKICTKYRNRPAASVSPR